MNSFIWRKKNITGGSGGSLTSLSADLNANSHKITNLAAPVNNGDATNKSYVYSVAGDRWYKLGFVQSGHIEPNQTNNAQVIDFTNYDLQNGMYSFVVKTSQGSNDISIAFYGVPIPNGTSYSVITASQYVSDNGNNHGFYIKLQRTTNNQIKLWFHNLSNGGFTVGYWGVFVKKEGDLISLT